jgi:hypothetical protein
MKILNADYGIDSIVTDKTSWYYWHRFPLLPIYTYKAKDLWNTSFFNFSWLNLRLWSDVNLAVEKAHRED